MNYLIAIDVGNTNIKFFLVDLATNQSQQQVIIPTEKKVTAHYVELIKTKITKNLIQKNIKDVFLVSVVPKLNFTLENICQQIFNKKLIIFQPQMLRRDNNASCGHDLIMLAIGGMTISPNFIIVSLGTATVFITINEAKPKGVIIAPGFKLNEECLINQKLLLKNAINYQFDSVLAKNTNDAASVGVIFGHVGMIQHIVKKIQNKFSKKIPVLITGGNSNYLKKYLNSENGYRVEPNLVLIGMLKTYKIHKNKLIMFYLKLNIFFQKIKAKLSLIFKKLLNLLTL